jgi:magnesium transporter
LTQSYLYDLIQCCSDWIAHGLLDSVVDSFFPFLEEVEKEVVEVDELVFSVDHVGSQTRQPQSDTITTKIPLHTDTHGTEMKVDPFKKFDASVDEKSQSPSGTMDAARTRFSLPRPTIPLIFRRLKRAIFSISISTSVPNSVEVNRTAANATASTLRRMARTRRLVTSLTRLLATKSEVVAQIRKRLLTTGQSGLGNGAGRDDDIEVAIYMGDVQGMSIYLGIHFRSQFVQIIS